MRVVHTLKVKGVAGAEKHLLILLAGLRARGIDAHCLYLFSPGQPVDEFMMAAQARGIPTQRMIIHGNLDVSLTRRLRAAYRSLAPDIVHTHLLHADLYGIPAAFSLRLGRRRPRIVSSRHNDDPFRYRAPLRTINRALWLMTDKGIAISEAVRQFSIEVEGARPNQISTIYYGYDPAFSGVVFDPALSQTVRAELNIAPEQLVVGVTCRLIEQKGLHYGIDAFALVLSQVQNALLLITGDGEMRPALETQVRALGIADRVRFLGWRADAARIMAAYDVFLMPSLWEGFGLVLLEAMAQRVPIVGSRVSAIPEIVADGETGLLVPPRDIEGLTSALLTLLQDAPLRRHMGLLGEERLETVFSVQRMVDETIALYEGLLR